MSRIMIAMAAGALVLGSGVAAAVQETAPERPAREKKPKADEEVRIWGDIPADGSIDESVWGERDRGLAEPGPMADAVGELEGNLFEDWSFERYTKRDPESMPWFHMARRNWRRYPGWVPFEITELRAHTGARSAFLHVNSAAQDGPTRIHGVVQDLDVGHMPRYVSGWYRVENWRRGATRQYVQVVAIARGGQVMPEGFEEAPNVQTAMVLAGVDEPPVELSNRRFHFAGPLEPDEGEWRFFEFDLRQVFQDLWGVVPDDLDGVRVFFEARYEYRGGGTPAQMDVFFDDLYLGDESRASDENTPVRAPLPAAAEPAAPAFGEDAGHAGG